jgi:hypothetical protein
MLGLRFARLVRAAIASGALVLAACPDGRQDTDTDTDTETDSDTQGSTGDGPTTIDPTTGPPDPPPPPPGDLTPPALVSAVLLDTQTLQLSFTEPIAPVDMVNPKRFRFSLAVGYFGTYGGQPQTFIRDPRYFNYTQYCQPCEPPDCYYNPYYCYYQPSEEILVAELYNHYADPNSLLLFLTEPIRPSLCNAVNQGGDTKISDAVLHLHYADGGLSQITDLAGIPLGPDGKFWVQYDGNYYVYNAPAFANFTPFVPIPCDFF